MHYDDPTWAELVERGKELLGKQSGLQWEWGDLALEVEPMAERERGEGGEFAGKTLERLEAWAEDIGFEAQTGKSFHTLRNYRKIAALWATSRRRLKVNWSIHETLAYHPERYDLIKTVETVAEARAIARGDYIPRNLGPGRRPLTRTLVRMSDGRAQLLSAFDDMRERGYYDDPDAREALEAEVELIETDLARIKGYLETGEVEEVETVGA